MKNGEVYTAPNLSMRGTAQWIREDQWLLLSHPVQDKDGGTQMFALADPAGTVVYTEAQLEARLAELGWIPVNFTVRLIWRPDR